MNSQTDPPFQLLPSALPAMTDDHSPAGERDVDPEAIDRFVTSTSWPQRAPSCPIRPLGARVIVELLDAEGETRGCSALIFTPDGYKPREQWGRVVAVGPGREYPKTGQRIPAGVKLGDVVIFTRFADERSLFGKLDAGKLAAISQEEILVVVEPESEAEAARLAAL